MTWRERCLAAQARGAFTAEDRERALDWMTCAVGEQHAAHPDVVVYLDPMEDPSPADRELELLGGYWGPIGIAGPRGFFGAVQTNNPVLALLRLEQIEDRVMTLKREAQP